MVLSNAERQKLFRQRQQERVAQAVTPDDVVKATRLIYDYDAAQSGGDRPSFAEWVAGLKGKSAALRWREWVPDGEAWQYEDLPAEDRALVLRVAAVIRAARFPPDNVTAAD